jgi:hypothetical protein
MERLTNKREADAQREEYERRLANGYPRNIPEERFLRLAAYEDTGMSPQACAEAREAGKVLSSCDISFGRLAELLTADKDGRLVVLPCQVGTATYYIHYPIAVYPDKSEPEIKRGYLYFVRFGSCWALRFPHPRGGGKSTGG